MATLDMPDSDTKWAYSAIIDMLNDRDRPLADNPTFICGFTGLSKRRWTIVRAWLLKHGYLIATDDGKITNPRFEREHAERLSRRDSAVQFGREGGLKSAQKRAETKQMDFSEIADNESSDFNELGQGYPQGTLGSREQPVDKNQSSLKGPFIPEKTATFLEDKSEFSTSASSVSNDIAQGDPQPSRARKRSENRIEDSVDSSSTDRIAREKTSTMRAQFRTVCDAAGYHPSDPEDIDKALSTLRSWLDAGADFEATVIPTIKAVIAKSGDDCTSSLKRFDRTMRHAIAKQGATPKPKPNGHPPPAEAIYIFEGETDPMPELRRDLAQALGIRVYASLAHSCRFEPVTEAHALRITGKTSDILKSGESWPKLQSIAKRHGFKDIW